MTGALRALGFFVARHARATVSVWLLLLVLAGVGALTLSKGATAQYTIPGAAFTTVQEDLQAKIPEKGVARGQIIIESSTGFSPNQREAVAEALTSAAELPDIVGVLDPFATAEKRDDVEEGLEVARPQLAEARTQLEQGKAAAAAARSALPEGLSEEAIADIAPELLAQEKELERAEVSLKREEDSLVTGERELSLAGETDTISADGTAALVTLALSKDPNSLTPQERENIFAAFNVLEDQGMTVNYSYELASDVSGVVGGSEALGLTVAFLVLLVTLGTVLAAGLPLMLALVGAGVGVGLVYASTAFVGMTATDPVLALMLGLGVGIDYAMLILYRFREELISGQAIQEAVAAANSTAGHSVLFAGLTNIVALAALTLTGLPFLSIMGLAGAFAVALVITSSLTLVPAVLSLLGRRVLTKKQRKTASCSQPAHKDTQHLPQNRREAVAQLESARGGWGGFVTRRPVSMILLSLAILLITIIPTASLRLGLPDGSYQTPDSTAFAAYNSISEHFGEGANGPIYAKVTLAVPTDEDRLRAVALDVADRLTTKDIDGIAIGAFSEDQSTALLVFFPSEGPSADSTAETVHSMIEKTEATEKATATTVGLTGQTVANLQISERISSSVPLYLGVVISLCLVLMAFAFRSLLVPLMATIGFLLSTLASFGAVVAVYQWGWLGDFFGVTQPGPILAFLPILLIGILFGLSVDYQIFIVSGMRDAHRAGHLAQDAVLLGYRQGGRVVTACGVIMIAVFAGFIFSHLTAVRPIGFALALGVAMDAFLIRTTFIPATMYLLGEKAWYWPFGAKEGDTQQEGPKHVAQ